MHSLRLDMGVGGMGKTKFEDMKANWGCGTQMAGYMSWVGAQGPRFWPSRALLQNGSVPSA